MVESAFHALTFSQPVEAELSAGQVAWSLPTGFAWFMCLNWTQSPAWLAYIW